MSILGAITHNFLAGVAVNAGHAFLMMHVLSQLKVKASARQAVGRELAFLVGGAVAFRFKYAGVGYANPARTIMAADAVVVRHFLGNQRMRLLAAYLLVLKVHDRGLRITLDRNIVAGRAAAALIIVELGHTGQIVLWLPEMAGSAELAVIIQGQRGLACFQELLYGDLGVLIVPLAPVIEQGGENAPVGGHERVLHLMDISRVAALLAAGLLGHAQVAGIQDHAFVGLILVNRLGITKMTGRAAQHLGSMSWVRLVVLMAGQAHLQETGSGDFNLLRPFSALLLIEQITKQGEDNEQGCGRAEELAGCGHGGTGNDCQSADKAGFLNALL